MMRSPSVSRELTASGRHRAALTLTLHCIAVLHPMLAPHVTKTAPACYFLLFRSAGLSCSRMKRPSAAVQVPLATGSSGDPKSRKKSEGSEQAVAVSVKVAELRSSGYADLEAWLQDSQNLYVGRRGRIFIHTDGRKRIFHYAGSKWHNPYAVGKSLSRQEACSKYRSALIGGTLKDPKDCCFVH